MDPQCQSLISGIIGQLLSGSPVNTVILTRAVLNTEKCPGTELAQLRAAYRGYLGETISGKIEAFEYLSNKEAAIISQAAFHYSIWTKRSMINALNFPGKCTLALTYPLQYLKAVIAPMAKN
nr:hypothetical protein K-LCC10_0334 [Kaumoebavirus]